jgi:hypothetical protein
VEIFAGTDGVQLFQQECGDQRKQAHGLKVASNLEERKIPQACVKKLLGRFQNRSERFDGKAHGAQKPECTKST